MKRDKNVYILGAGFSAAAGVPMMRTFLQSAREHHDSPSSTIPPDIEAHYDKVFKFRQDAKRSRDAIALDLENIESLFSLMDMAGTLQIPGAPTSDSVKHLIAHTVCRTRQLDKQMVRLAFEDSSLQAARLGRHLESRATRNGTFRHVDMTLYEAAIGILAGLFDPLNGAESTFVTFNYDTVVEDALWLLERGRADYRVSRSPYKGSRQAAYQVPLLKLHGSANWAYVQKANTYAHTFDTYEDMKDPVTGDRYVPILVPPTWKKGDLSSMSEEIWRGAYDALANATRVCIIGFSMPETDPHFKHLIAAALSDNPGLYSLTVVDRSASAELRQRYESFFAPLISYGRFTFLDGGLEDFVFSREFTRLGRGAGVASANAI